MTHQIRINQPQITNKLQNAEMLGDGHGAGHALLCCVEATSPDIWRFEFALIENGVVNGFVGGIGQKVGVKPFLAIP